MHISSEVISNAGIDIEVVFSLDSSVSSQSSLFFITTKGKQKMKQIATPGFRKIVSPKDQQVRVVPVEGREEKPKTVKELLELYKCTIKPNDFSATLSTLTRYGVPALSGPSPKTSRASSEEIEAALRILDKTSVLLLDQLEEKQEKYFEALKLPSDQDLRNCHKRSRNSATLALKN
jgi:hypothetical protein